MVHATDLELDVVGPSFDPTLLGLPLGDASLDDFEFGWFSPPQSPLDSPDIFTQPSDALPTEFSDFLLSKGSERQHPGASGTASWHWESILHGVPAPESAKKQATAHHQAPAKMATSSVMWNCADEEAIREILAAPSSSASSTASSWTPPPSPPLEDDIDFQAFVKTEFSQDGIILVDSMNSAATKRKQAEDALALQTKRAKLQLQRPKTAIQSDTPESKRHTHNVLERKRREDLKYSYQNLRLQVPDLSNAERAPTGQILNKAANYVLHLKAQEEELVQQLAVIRAENQRLRASIAHMAEQQEQSE